MKTFGKRRKCQATVERESTFVSHALEEENRAWWKQKPLKRSPHLLETKKKKQVACPENQLTKDKGRAKKCSCCGFFYTPGEEKDEKLHLEIHKTYINQQVSWNLRSASITYIREYTDGFIWRGYVKDNNHRKSLARVVQTLLQVSEEELGKDITCVNKRDIYMYIYVLKEPQYAVGFVLFSNSYTPHCGIRRIWVAKPYRQKRIATSYWIPFDRPLFQDLYVQEHKYLLESLLLKMVKNLPQHIQKVQLMLHMFPDNRIDNVNKQRFY
eukprot:jgi/Galph1/3599/GphlegSOOS_G2272.1